MNEQRKNKVPKTLNVQTVTVVGANGTMGKNVSAVFASIGNAKIYMVCRSLEKSKEAKEKTCQLIQTEKKEDNLIVADYSMLEDCIAKSDIVFESTAEDWEIKSSVTARIADAASGCIEECENTVFCTGSSGLSITGLSQLMPEMLRGNYMGIHMFNPPFSVTLCEMSSTEATNRALFEAAKQYFQNVLHRTVVEVKDTPAFLANRIGFWFINSALQCAERYKYNGGIDYVDSILGPVIGGSIPPLGVSNFVGLDVHKAIVDNLYENTNDIAHDDFIFPEFAKELIACGSIGRKTDGGLYKTVQNYSSERIRLVYDIAKQTYRPVRKYSFPVIEKVNHLLHKNNLEFAFQPLVEDSSKEAEICLRFLLKYVLYALVVADRIGCGVHTADKVMKAGFHWYAPTIMIKAFGGSDGFAILCMKHLDAYLLKHLDFGTVLKNVD